MIDLESFTDTYGGENWAWDRETTVKAQGRLTVLRESQHIMAFVVAKNALDVVKPLAVKLQKRDLDIYSAYKMIDERKEIIKDMRTEADDHCHEWFDKEAGLLNPVDPDIKVPRIVKRMTQRANAPSQSPEEYFKRNLVIPFLDHLNEEMNARFNPENRPGIYLKDTESKLMFWENDLPMPSALISELKDWQRHWKKQENYPDNIMMCFTSADEDLCPNIRRLLTIAATLSVTSAEAEGICSSLRLIKTHLRSTMCQEHLSGLTLMHLKQEQFIDSEEIVHLYIGKHRRRLFEKCILYQ